MREVKFRGQRLDKSGMVEGDLIHGVGSSSGRMFILPNVKGCEPFYVEVIPKSVGEYTGVRDKSGREVYEGDIRMFETGIGIVVWVDLAFAIKSPGSEAIDWEPSSVLINSKFLGNIYENPELAE